MIVTRELLVHLGACQEAMDWLDTQNIWGLSRLEFIRFLKESNCPPDYSEWAASKKGLFSGEATEFSGTGTKRNIWRVIGDGFDPSVKYDNLEDIKILIDAFTEEKTLAESTYFHVYARYLHSDGGYVYAPCNDDSHTSSHNCHYVTSNMFTGEYEQFDNFIDAQQRCLEIKKLRKASYAAKYSLFQKIEEPDSNEGAIGDLLVYTGATL